MKTTVISRITICILISLILMLLLSGCEIGFHLPTMVKPTPDNEETGSGENDGETPGENINPDQTPDEDPGQTPDGGNDGESAAPCEHIFEAATCLLPAKCSLCQQTSGEPLGHTPSDWTLVSAPTQESAGEIVKSCTLCTERTDREILPILNDENYVKRVDKQPDCTSGGLDIYTGVFKGYTCSFEVETKASHTYNGIPVDDKRVLEYAELTEIFGNGLEVLNTNMSDISCTETKKAAFYCGVCEMPIVITVSGAHKLTADNTVVPDCEKGGYTEYTCQVCGLEKTGAFNAPYGHPGHTILEDKCDYENGVIVIYCSICDREISFSAEINEIIIQPVTCETPGSKKTVYSYTLPNGKVMTKEITEAIPILPGVHVCCGESVDTYSSYTLSELYELLGEENITVAENGTGCAATFVCDDCGKLQIILNVSNE